MAQGLRRLIRRATNDHQTNNTDGPPLPGCSESQDEVTQDAMRESSPNFESTSYFHYDGFTYFFNYGGSWFVSGAGTRCVVI